MEVTSELLEDAIKEVRTSNRFILKRLNQVVEGHASCKCECHTTESAKELVNLKHRVAELEEIMKSKNKEVQSLKDRLQTLEELFDSGQVPETPQPSKFGEDLCSSKSEVSVQAPQPPVDIYSYHATIEHTKSETRASESVLQLDSNITEGEQFPTNAATLTDFEKQTAVSSEDLKVSNDQENSSESNSHNLSHSEAEHMIAMNGTHTIHIDKKRDISQKRKDSDSVKKKVRFIDQHESDNPNKGPLATASALGNESLLEHSVKADTRPDNCELEHVRADEDAHLSKTVDDKTDSEPFNTETVDPRTDFSHNELKYSRDDSQAQKSIALKEDGATTEMDNVSQEKDDENIPEDHTEDTHRTQVSDGNPGNMVPTAAIPKRQITKANFHKKSLSESLGVRVIEQTEKKTISLLNWSFAADREMNEARKSGLISMEGLVTIVLVDISHSMTEGNAWEQAKSFFEAFIEGLKESMMRFNIDKEHVALVTFGHKTEVLKRLTNDFSSLQLSFDGLSLGGPSPMHGGLLLAVAAAQSTASSGAVVNGIPVATKIVIISDGRPTETNLVAGPDVALPAEQEDTNCKVLEVLEKIEGKYDVFLVPVGNANMDFFKLMQIVSVGKMLSYKDGRRIGTRLRKTLLAGGNNLLESFSRHLGHHLDTASDEEDIKDILESAEKKASHKNLSQYMESDNKELPLIGSRVRRGPEWKYDNQDSGGPGTVIGHADNDHQIWIEWDNDEQTNIYSYSMLGGYDVLVVDEPRLPKADGRLAVGCIVKPGKDWKQRISNVKCTDRGVVIKTVGERRVQVRWPNKERGDYSDGYNGQFEVEFCPSVEEARGFGGHNPHQTEVRGYIPYTQAAPNKNKNKNVTNKNVANKNTAKKSISNKNKN